MPSARSRPPIWTGPSLCSRRSASTRSSISMDVWFGEDAGRLEWSCNPCSPSAVHRSCHLPKVLAGDPRFRGDVADRASSVHTFAETAPAPFGGERSIRVDTRASFSSVCGLDATHHRTRGGSPTSAPLLSCQQRLEVEQLVIRTPSGQACGHRRRRLGGSRRDDDGRSRLRTARPAPDDAHPAERGQVGNGHRHPRMYSARSRDSSVSMAIRTNSRPGGSRTSRRSPPPR